MSAEPEYICDNAACDVGQKKICVEGLELSKCPHFGKPLVEDEDAESEEGPAGEVLPLGAKLSISQASELLAAGMSRVVAMIGPSDAGKTSLIAGLYDLYQMGNVAGTGFRRSLTLFEFEQTCHDSRGASRGEPHQSRTPRGEVQFYHIDLAVGPDADNVALALADRGGEEYQDAMDEISKVDEFVEIQRADTICILVDGARLLDSGARHNLKFEVHQILSALSEGGSLKRKPQLALVLTKVDLISGAEFEARARADVAEIVSAVSAERKHLFRSIQSFEVAASPTTTTLPRGTGLPELLKYWLIEPVIPQIDRQKAIPSERMFGRFGTSNEGDNN